jgi:hypothetical protein
MKRIFIFEEFGSAVFAGLSSILYSFLALRYYRAVKKAQHDLGIHAAKVSSEKYILLGTYLIYYILWVITFASAFIFHTVDTPLTEKLDDFTCFASVMFTVHANFVQ